MPLLSHMQFKYSQASRPVYPTRHLPSFHNHAGLLPLLLTTPDRLPTLIPYHLVLALIMVSLFSIME